MAMRLSGTMNADQRLPVGALVKQRELQLQRSVTVTLADDARLGAEHRRQNGGGLGAKGGDMTIRRIYEDKIVLAGRRSCTTEEPKRIAPAQLGIQAGGLQVAADRRLGRPGDVHQRGLGGTPGQGLDRQRPGAGEQVEDPQTVQRTEDREERLTHAVGGRTRVGPRGCHQSSSPA